MDEAGASASNSTSALQDCTNQGASTSFQENRSDPPEAKRRKIRVMGVPLDFDQVRMLPLTYFRVRMFKMKFPSHILNIRFRNLMSLLLKVNYSQGNTSDTTPQMSDKEERLNRMKRYLNHVSKVPTKALVVGII